MLPKDPEDLGITPSMDTFWRWGYPLISEKHHTNWGLSDESKWKKDIYDQIVPLVLKAPFFHGMGSGQKEV